MPEPPVPIDHNVKYYWSFKQYNWGYNANQLILQDKYWDLMGLNKDWSTEIKFELGLKHTGVTITNDDPWGTLGFIIPVVIYSMVWLGPLWVSSWTCLNLDSFGYWPGFEDYCAGIFT